MFPQPAGSYKNNYSCFENFPSHYFHLIKVCYFVALLTCSNSVMTTQLLWSQSKFPFQQVHDVVLPSDCGTLLLVNFALHNVTCLNSGVRGKGVEKGNRGNERRFIEHINHFLDRGFVVSFLMDLHHFSVNHITVQPDWTLWAKWARGHYRVFYSSTFYYLSF